MTKGGEGPPRLSSKAGCPVILQKEKSVPDPTDWRTGTGRNLASPGAARFPWAEDTTPPPVGPATPYHPLPRRVSCSLSRPTLLPFQKYIAQVLQDSEVDGDGDGGPGSSGDEPPSSSSQDEELLMPPGGLTDTDFQSCEDSLIENEIHQ